MKTSKFLAAIFSLVIFLGIIAGGTGLAFAAPLDNGPMDEVFLSGLDEFIADNYSGEVEVVAVKEELYDLELNPLGYVYDFSVNGDEGFAIVISTEQGIAMTEFYFDAPNPYAGVGDGQRIYVSFMIYAYYADGVYYLADNNMVIDDITFEVLSQDNYCGYWDFTYTSTTIYYTARTETKYDLAKRNPAVVMDTSILPYSCVPVAAASVIQFYDRYSTGLIPNFTPGSTLGSYYLYTDNDTVMATVVANLMSDMGMTAAGGATILQCLTGMDKYCDDRGYNFSYSSCMSLGALNFNTVKQQIDLGKPILLFVRGFSIATITANTGNDVVSYAINGNAHAMAGFGYYEITYTLTGGGSRTDKYIAVASGLMSQRRGYFNVAYSTTVDGVYSIVIA